MFSKDKKCHGHSNGYSKLEKQIRNFEIQNKICIREFEGLKRELVYEWYNSMNYKRRSYSV